MLTIKDFMKKWVLPPGVSESVGRLLYPNPERKESPVEIGALLDNTKKIKDRHKGERCFILGAGSSVKKQDLQKLAGEYVVSVSSTFVHPDCHIFKPAYHVVPPILGGHGGLNPYGKYVEWLREMEIKTLNAEMFFHIGDRGMIENNRLFRNRVIHWIDNCHWDGNYQPNIDLAKVPEIWSVSELAITVAIYLGFDKIYLLGFDHDWFKDSHVYFYDLKKELLPQPDKSKLDFVDSEFQMRRHAEIFKKYKYLYSLKKNVFNANADPESYVDVFPKVDFNTLFRDGEE